MSLHSGTAEGAITSVLDLLVTSDWSVCVLLLSAVCLVLLPCCWAENVPTKSYKDIRRRTKYNYLTRYVICCGGIMDSSSRRLFQRLMRRIPAKMLRTTLEKWGRLAASQLRCIDFTHPKSTLAETLLDIFEVCGVFVKSNLSSTLSKKKTTVKRARSLLLGP